MESSKSKRPVIIAEAGVNHNGSLETALKMVDVACEAGANYIKFQTFKTELLVSRNTPSASYQKKNCGVESQFEMLKKLELNCESFKLLKEYCYQKGIGFLSTPFDTESLEFLVNLGMDYIKVPSGEITNLPFLREIAKTHIPAIISTGMSTIEDIKNVIDVFRKENYNDNMLVLLHCNTQYPTPLHDVNLRAMESMRKIFGIPVGYSDHTKGIEVALAASALGAEIIEKHFTLDNSMEGPDHAASLNPEELKSMVRNIHNIREALGSAVKTVSHSEMTNMAAARKSIVASRHINKGEIFSEDNLTVKRPGTGISPMLWDEIIGKKATVDYEKDEIIRENFRI